MLVKPMVKDGKEVLGHAVYKCQTWINITNISPFCNVALRLRPQPIHTYMLTTWFYYAGLGVYGQRCASGVPLEAAPLSI